jgi:hypothetical protein
VFYCRFLTLIRSYFVPIGGTGRERSKLTVNAAAASAALDAESKREQNKLTLSTQMCHNEESKTVPLRFGAFNWNEKV